MLTPPAREVSRLRTRAGAGQSGNSQSLLLTKLLIVGIIVPVTGDVDHFRAIATLAIIVPVVSGFFVASARGDNLQAQAIEQGLYREFYMHRTGHWLGMDVHDVGDYKVADEWRQLEVGMVLTVEPGLYISPDCEKVAAKWRGIGVRIEDDVLVTKTGHEVMTDAAPKQVIDIEQLMRG